MTSLQLQIVEAEKRAFAVRAAICVGSCKRTLCCDNFTSTKMGDTFVVQIELCSDKTVSHFFSDKHSAAAHTQKKKKKKREKILASSFYAAGRSKSCSFICYLILSQQIASRFFLAAWKLLSSNKSRRLQLQVCSRCKCALCSNKPLQLGLSNLRQQPPTIPNYLRVKTVRAHRYTCPVGW